MANQSPSPLPHLGLVLPDTGVELGGGHASPLPLLSSLFGTAVRYTLIAGGVTVVQTLYEVGNGNDPLTVTLRAHRRLIAAPVTVALTASTATFNYAQGTLGGGAPSPLLMLGSLLAPAAGFYSMAAQGVVVPLTASTATFVRGKRLIAEPVTIATSVAPATSWYELNAEPITIAVTASTATFVRAGLVLTAGTGVYTLTGQQAGLNKQGVGTYVLPANAGAYTLSGQDATLRRGRVLPAAAGSYTLTGNAASYIASGVTFDIWVPETPAGGTWTPATPATTTWTPA